jgi:hypothetical protein
MAWGLANHLITKMDPDSNASFLQASAEALRLQEELKTGVFATEGGTKLSYRVTHGLSYKTVTETLDGGPRSREEILDLRMKKKSDKYC